MVVLEVIVMFQYMMTKLKKFGTDELSEETWQTQGWVYHSNTIDTGRDQCPGSTPDFKRNRILPYIIITRCLGGVETLINYVINMITYVPHRYGTYKHGNY